MGSDVLPWFKFYPRDFHEGTVGMKHELKGVYALVLALIYMHSGSLPDDSGYISGQLGCTKRKWRSLRDELLKADKIQLQEGKLHNYRADIELEKLRNYRGKQANRACGSRKNNGLTKPRHSHSETESEKKEKRKKMPERNREAKKCAAASGSNPSIHPELLQSWAVRIKKGDRAGLSVLLPSQISEMLKRDLVNQDDLRAVDI